MLSILSPAKKLDFTPPKLGIESSVPKFREQAIMLAKTAEKLSVEEIKNLMQISNNLAELNKLRFENFTNLPQQESSKQAALAFAGDTYKGLNAQSLSIDQLNYAQSKIRILSGIYGVLRPLDLIQPYRLEMGSKLVNTEGKNLYQFWKEKITKSLLKELESHKNHVIINLASLEYFKAVDDKLLKDRIVTPQFFEKRSGQLKNISFYSKRARGAMARFIITNQVDNPKYLKDFDLDGYIYDKQSSITIRPVFFRDQEIS